MCSFSPIYGQSVSVAAMEARALLALLRAGTPLLAPTWFAATAAIVDTAWQLAIGADLAVRAVDGWRTPATRALNRYLVRLQAAVHDPRQTARLIDVLGLVDPPTRLLGPNAISSVLRGGLRAR